MQQALPKLILVAALAGCSTTSVQTDYDHQADFQALKTFKIVGGRTIDHGTETNDTLIKDRVNNALAAALESRGLQQVQDNPDLYVGYVAGARTQQELESFDDYGMAWDPWAADWWGPGYDDFWVENYEEGTLTVDLIDANTKKLVWRSSAVSTAEDLRSDKNIREVVDKSIDKFPPDSKKKKSHGES